MFEFIFTGIGYGLLLSVMIGPAFFILLETSITKGVKAALWFDLGVLLSDLVYLGIAFIFFNQVTALMESEHSYLLRIVGGIFFVFIGIVNVRKKKPTITKKQLEETSQLSAGNYLMTCLKGFTFNAVNPGVLFYWLTLMSILPKAPVSMGLDRTQEIFGYIAIILVTFFSIDVLKIFGAKKLRKVLTPAWMRHLNLALGIVLIAFGVLFLTQGFLMRAEHQ
ncbi:LysE family translocator [Paracrocinitomix mangrovi]|uniref:LysE family translocator n=1 Tax=Paracrocinitomix mangrovi TaxID=2862509 RepID=UPI001C8DB42E|nr:LysE family translocator [Paracrocinitomix mangrovi]UKN00141.1 LysE family translocator [Paracrocinitomix mangrovi]